LRVLFYDDAPDFGGHELQTLAAARYMASQPGIEVGFIYFRGNARLSRQIADSAARNSNFKPLAQDYSSKQYQFVRTLLSGHAIRRIAGEMMNFAPDVIVIAQGAIAFCSAGLMAARKIGLPTISYIPMTHPERFFSESRFKAALREPVNRIYYRLPDAYITISPRMEDYLRRKGLKQPMTVVQAAIDLAEWHTVEKTAARDSLGLAAGDWVVALIGRVQFWQKRQDLAIRGLALARRQIPNLKLLLVGDGPDLGALKELVRAEGVEDIVVFAGWTDGLSVVYSAIDALVIPSRYEGVPLVMLQALYFRRPVIASAVDGMLDILPPHWLFGSGDSIALATRLVEASRASESDLLDAQKKMVIRTHSLPIFQRAFMDAVMSATDRLRRHPTTRQRAEIS
jgi:glycosyltransferase involved in cell wall biosynthesis